MKTGFTLIELLIALAIFSLIGIATTQQVRQIAATKEIAEKELDSYTGLRTAISLMRSDLNQTFHVLYEELDAATRNAIQQNQKAAHTIFIGTNDELAFTSLSHRVYYADRRESEQTEISYFLEKNQQTQYSDLMKRESLIIDEDPLEGGNVTPLITSVQTLKFQYWDDRQQKWVDRWNSDNAETRDRFPLAIKMQLAVANEEAPLQLDMTFKLAFPHNEPLVAKF